MLNPFLQNLNKAQCEAVLCGEGPVLVAAGPGSGKTFTITRRLFYMIYERQIPAEQILVITFTKEAALSMQERFHSQREQFSAMKLNQKGFVSFATFHSFFYQIIKSIKKYSEYQLITLQEKKRIILPILKKYTNESVTELQVKSFLAQVSYYRNTGLLNEDMEEGTLFLQQLEEYETAKQAYKRLDFDDMIWLCKKELIDNPELLLYWQKRYPYILIDEFQDIGPVQYQIIKLLSVPPYNLFVVGDDDQAIYGFRGSDSAIFHKFMKDYPKAKLLPMAINYRCGDNIVKASRRLIEKNQSRTIKELVSGAEKCSKGQIQVYSAVDTRECSDKLIKELKNKSLNELNGEAILFRTNASMQRFAASLAFAKIPFVHREKCDSIYEHFLIKDIMDYVHAANGCLERSLYLRIFQKQGIYNGREALRMEQVDMEQVKKVYREGFYEDRYTVERLDALERHLSRLKTMRPKLAITYILHGMNYEKYLLQKAGVSTSLPQDWQEVLDWLQTEARQFSSFPEWLEYQKKNEQTLSQVISSGKECKGIHLLTLHAAKGLEFEKVYIVQLNEGILPQYGRGEILTKEREEEERRLFYVGMTRAKEELVLCYLTGTKENPKVKSRFLEDIGIEKV